MSKSSYTTSQTNASKLILDRWKTSLKNRDRKLAAVEANFEDLVAEMHSAEIPFDLAEEILLQAIILHYPAPSIAKIVYDGAKSTGRTSKTRLEFLDDWRDEIKSMAKSAFYHYYKLETDELVAKNNSKKKAVGMPEKEYRPLRKYADSFPILDTTNIEVKIKGKVEDLAKVIEEQEDEQ